MALKSLPGSRGQHYNFHMRKLLALFFVAGPLFAAYEFSDTSFAISVIQAADWNCVSDMKQDGSGILEFSGKGLEAVIFYGKSPKLKTSQGAVRAFLEEATRQIDSLSLVAEDTVTLWNRPGYCATYRGFAEGKDRAGRIYSLVEGESFITVILVKKGAKRFSEREESAIREFLQGIEVNIK